MFKTRMNSTTGEPMRIYVGPIGVGMHFIWEPDNPRAWTHVVVIRIDAVPHDERRIWTKTLNGNRFNPVDQETWNEEGRFREACVPCDERGVRTSQ